MEEIYLNLFSMFVGNSTASGDMLAELCGESEDIPQFPIYSSGNSITVVFLSDDFLEFGGFLASAQAGGWRTSNDSEQLLSQTKQEVKDLWHI